MCRRETNEEVSPTLFGVGLFCPIPPPVGDNRDDSTIRFACVKLRLQLGSPVMGGKSVQFNFKEASVDRVWEAALQAVA